jgi:HEAT repeat protein
MEKHCSIADSGSEAEFREAVASTIPLVIERLEDEDWGVRLKTVEVIGKLANHGEQQLTSIAAQLTTSTKLK